MLVSAASKRSSAETEALLQGSKAGETRPAYGGWLADVNAIDQLRYTNPDDMGPKTPPQDRPLPCYGASWDDERERPVCGKG